MHISRIAIRHWRRHDELVIDQVSERINLIRGPNETGKSTIAEALRFALFEPSKPTYDSRKAILARSGGEAPEVEVELRIDTQPWKIHKRFLKRQQTRLTGPDGRTLDGEDAERRIQELLGFTVSGVLRVTKDVENRNLGLWPILWLRQGELSGLDEAVTDGVRKCLSDLVAREVGGIAAGPRGSRALTLVQKEYESFWTGTANRATGAYAQALKERDAARARRDQARTHLQTYESAVRELQVLTDRLGALAPRLRDAEDHAEAARKRARQAAERLGELERHRVQLGELRRAAEDAAKLVRKRAALEAELAALRADLGRQGGHEAELAGEHDRREQAQLRREGEAVELQKAAQAAQDRADQANEMAERSRLAALLAERAAALARAEALLGDQRNAVAAVNAIPELTPRTLNGLKEKADLHQVACMQRDAAATAITFHAERALTATWTAEGETTTRALAPGGVVDGRTTGLGELRLDGIGTVRIRTGAGTAADLADSARAAGEALAAALAKAGVASLDEAQALVQRRAEAVSASREATASLAAALGLPAKAEAGTIAAAVEELRREIASGRARLGAQPAAEEPHLDPDAVRSQARSQARAAREAAEAAQAGVNLARTELAGLRERLAAARTAVAVLRDRGQRLGDELGRLPDEAELVRRRDAAARAQGDGVNRENDLALAWEALGGAGAVEEAEALAGVSRRLQEDIQAARSRRDILIVQLRASAEQDPAAALQEAAADLDRLDERATALERQARAVKTLRDTLLAVQRETRAALAAPVRAAIEPYLRRIFPQADLLLGDDDWQLAGFADGRAEEPFDQLSLGAREQFALLVRLGLAEVFAQGRRLPLVLDDPLINADPARRAALIQALRHAARRLQIFLFTCHEAEHDALAADRIITLSGTRG